MTRIRSGDGKLTIDPDTDEGQTILTKLHADKERVICICATPPVAMYLSRGATRIAVKRMPGTGTQHAPDCESFEPPPSLSGVGPLIGTAIVDGDNASTQLRLGFPLSHRAGRPPNVSGDGGTGTTAKAQPQRLTLRALLHYLWDEAQLTHWRPQWAGRRHWSAVYRHLSGALASKFTTTGTLAASTYIPEPFIADVKDAITERRRAHLAQLAAPKGGSNKPLMIAIGEIKTIAQGKTSPRITLKQVPDFHFSLSDDLRRAIERRFAAELGLWNADDRRHLVAAFTFELARGGYATIDEITLMVTTANWIPIESDADSSLIGLLTDHHRHFIKTLRYGLPPQRPIASAVLVDTQPGPVALYLLQQPPTSEEASVLEDLVKSTTYPAWWWIVSAGAPPRLPALHDYRGQPPPSPVDQHAEDHAQVESTDGAPK